MASSSRWSSRSRSDKQQQYELPRWHESAMATSIIPPPIVSFSKTWPAPESSILPSRTVVLEKPQASESHESELQADLQFLLDAQAEALLRGAENDDRSSAGSVTPTTRSLQSGVPHQVNRPVRRRIGLHSARKGIYSCILALSAIKAEEFDSTERAVQAKEHDLEQIQAWETKKQGLKEASTKLDSAEETVRIQRLKQEAENVQEDIIRVETELSELKTRHRQLLRQAAAVENSVQAKLATYTSSLNMLESDIKQFLSANPNKRNVEPKPASQQSVWQLPPQRRTLELAREQIKVDREELREQAEMVRTEKDALDEGAVIWKQVAAKVTDYEKLLRAEMGRLASAMTESTQAWDESPRENRTGHMKELYKNLQSLIDELATQHARAEERGWTLLIAAIGAELDALRRGEEILAAVVDHVESGSNGSKEHDQELIQTNDEVNDTAQITFKSEMPQRDAKHDIDDEPDPDLLFSVQDGDDD